MAINVGSDGGYSSEINITPLVDVVLVLLIIFMVLVPVMMRGYDVDIPGETAAAATLEPEQEQIVLTIDLATCPAVDPPQSAGMPSDCTVRINETEVAVADLAGQVTETFGERESEDRVLFLAAHERLNYEAVMQILDIAKSGVEELRIGLVTGE